MGAAAGAALAAPGYAPAPPTAISASLNRVIHFLFLCDMNSHQDLDRLDDALSIADQIAIRLLRRRIFGKAREQPGKVQDFTMRAAHGRETVTIGKDAGERRIDFTLVVAFVHDHLLLDDGVGFGDQCGRCRGRRIVESIGDAAQAIKAATECPRGRDAV